MQGLPRSCRAAVVSGQPIRFGQNLACIPHIDLIGMAVLKSVRRARNSLASAPGTRYADPAGDITMRFLLLSIGTTALMVGAIWIGQGTGYFPYPGSSFMINDSTWAYIGGGVVVGSLVLIYLARGS
jgi:hypothetical protein